MVTVCLCPVMECYKEQRFGGFRKGFGNPSCSGEMRNLFTASHILFTSRVAFRCPRPRWGCPRTGSRGQNGHQGLERARMAGKRWSRTHRVPHTPRPAAHARVTTRSGAGGQAGLCRPLTAAPGPASGSDPASSGASRRALPLRTGR